MLAKVSIHNMYTIVQYKNHRIDDGCTCTDYDYNYDRVDVPCVSVLEEDVWIGQMLAVIVRLVKMGIFKSTEITYTWKSVPHAICVIAILSKSDHLRSAPAISPRY